MDRRHVPPVVDLSVPAPQRAGEMDPLSIGSGFEARMKREGAELALQIGWRWRRKVGQAHVAVEVPFWDFANAVTKLVDLSRTGQVSRRSGAKEKT